MRIASIRFFLVILLPFFLYACGGGGGGESVNTHGDITYSLNPSSIDSNKLDGDEKVAVTAECVSKDVFAASCTIDKVRVTLDGRETVLPINLKLNVKEKKTFDVVVLGSSEKRLEPFSYLSDSNPSTAVTGWTSYSENIGLPDTKTIAYGNETCTQELNILPPTQVVNSTTGGKAVFTVYGGTPPYSVFSSDVSYPPSPSTLNASGETFSVIVNAGSPENTITYTVRDSVSKTKTATLTIKKVTTTLTASQSQTCEPVKTFSAVIPNYTPGTLVVQANNQKLEEKTIGVLTGNGSGTVKKVTGGYQVDVTFSTGVAKGVPITASFITPLKPLTQTVKNEADFRFIYGDLTLYLQNSMLIDSSGKTYGMLLDRQITLSTALGNKGSTIVVTYLGEPFKASGGEILGKGDGVNKSFALKTKYAPLVPDKLVVFSEKQPGVIKFVNLSTGNIVVEFANPPAIGENILASYVISEVNKTAKIELLNQTGVQGNHDISVRLKRP